MKKYITLLMLAVFACILPVAQTGCTTTTSTQVTEVNTLKAIGASAKAAMDASTQLLKQNQLTVAQWQKIANFYDGTFQPAFNLAVSAVNSNLSSVASPDLIALGAQFAAFVAQVAPNVKI